MPSPTYNFPAAAPIATPWHKPARGAKTYILVAGGVVVLVMVMMVLNSLSVVPFHLFGSDPSPSTRPVASPLAPSTTRTDYARADRFLSLSLGPALDAVNQTVPNLQVCNGTLSVSCLNAVTATDQEMKKLLVVIDHGDIPLCIAPGMSKMRADFAEMETALQFAIKGFQLNRSFDVNAGVRRFAVVSQAWVADGNAVGVALRTQCDTQATGP
jgi:hypothetical protein